MERRADDTERRRLEKIPCYQITLDPRMDVLSSLVRVFLIPGRRSTDRPEVVFGVTPWHERVAHAFRIPGIDAVGVLLRASVG